MRDDRELKLLPGHTRVMTSDEEDELVSALAELLADWLGRHPDQAAVIRRSLPQREKPAGK